MKKRQWPENQAFLVEIRGGSILIFSRLIQVLGRSYLGCKIINMFLKAHYLLENTIISTINDTPFTMITKSAKEIIKGST